MKNIDKDEMQDKYLELQRRFSTSEYLMLWFAAGAIILGITGFVVQYREAVEPLDLFGRIFLVLSLFWMSIGFLFFYRSLWGGVRIQKISSEILDIIDVDVKTPVNVNAHFEAIEKGKVLSQEYSVLSMALLAVVLGINSILIRVESSDIFSRILEIVALIWLIGASFFLYDVLKHLQVTGKLRNLYSLGKASIEYSDDMTRDSKILESQSLGIRGRPDYILEEKGEMIPVEVKTGRVPRGPHFSHILQLAAYFVLVEEHYGKRPNYGFIRYGKEKEFRIDFDAKLEKILKDKMKEMRKCIKKGEAHRNHNRKNKCRYCSRREGCPERLA
jgi:CRISPR-associated exonuclease Cas4